MTPYIMLNGLSSNHYTVNLRVNVVDRFMLPNIVAHREPLPGSVGGGPTVFSMPPQPIKIMLQATGTDRADAIQKLTSQRDWFMSARTLQLWTDPDWVYTGRVEGVSPISYTGRRHAHVTFDFMCDPPYATMYIGSFIRDDGMFIRQKLMPVVGVDGALLPIIEDDYGRTTTGVSVMSSYVDYKSSDGASSTWSISLREADGFVMNLIGTWSTGFKVWGGNDQNKNFLKLEAGVTKSTRLIIDGVNELVYTLKDGKRQAFPYSGDFPVIHDTTMSLNVGGGVNANLKYKVVLTKRR